jgi:hypothetical protein
MAATIAKCRGLDSSREKEAHRLGARASEAQANTWRTFSTAFVRADGSGYVEVHRDGALLHRFEFSEE